jgi:hypothetical protein
MESLINQIDCVKEKETQQNKKIDRRGLLKNNKSMYLYLIHKSSYIQHQSPATCQPAVFFSHNKSAPATSQPNKLLVEL